MTSATVIDFPVITRVELPCDCEPSDSDAYDITDIFVFELARPFADKVRALAAKDDCDPDECARALLIFALAAVEKGIIPDVMSFYARTMYRPTASRT